MDNGGQTPLMVAIFRARGDIAVGLLCHGPDASRVQGTLDMRDYSFQFSGHATKFQRSSVKNFTWVGLTADDGVCSGGHFHHGLLVLARPCVDMSFGPAILS